MSGATMREHHTVTEPSSQARGWRGSGRDWRVLAAITIALWIAVAVLFGIALALNNVWVAVAGLSLLPLDWWVSSRRLDMELVEDPLHSGRDIPPDELELRQELAAIEDDRERDALVLDKWLDDDPVLMRLRYPSRGLLLTRSAAEAVELLGVGLVIVGFPSVWLVALGGFLWMVGGRSGASVVGMLFAERLRRTPVSDTNRERWLKIEQRAVWAVCAALLVIAAIRFL